MNVDMEAIRLAVWLGDDYSFNESEAWLHTPHVGIGGAKPADLIAAGRHDEVMALFDHGVSAPVHSQVPPPIE